MFVADLTAPDLCDWDAGFSQHGFIQLLVSATKKKDRLQTEATTSPKPFLQNEQAIIID